MCTYDNIVKKKNINIIKKKKRKMEQTYEAKKGGIKIRLRVKMSQCVHITLLKKKH